MFGRTKKLAARATNGFTTICVAGLYGKTENSRFELRGVVLAGMAWLAVAGEMKAEAQPGGSFTNLTDISLEQLVNIEVTSVSKKENRLNQSPAAISVITQEDIRRSGLTSIPELLRLAPGMDVAQINASTWAISSRGFNGQFADKLLVLVDGRSIYAPAFGGVFWGLQDTVLEDLDRIEIIRGPGATLWGANAVNGVINIITKSAKETQGLLISTSAGTEEQPATSLRYGGQLGSNVYYRVYAKYVNHDNFVDASGNETADSWDALRGGARLDWEATEGDLLTLQGDYYGGTFNHNVVLTSLTPPYAQNITSGDYNSGGNLLGRWTHDFTGSSQLTVQGYYDHTRNADAGTEGLPDVYDFDAQHRFALGQRQDIVWGAGYRYSHVENRNASFITWNPPVRHDQLYSAFAQDDITVVEDRLHLTLGSKVEHNDYTGFEFEPSGRLLWTPSEKQTVWGAVSRAVRTPAVFETSARYNSNFLASPFAPPVQVALSGNPNFKSEEVLSYELGYRIEPTRRLSFDLATYYTIYDRLRFFGASGAPFFQPTPVPHMVVPEEFNNGLSASTYGAEVSAQWQAADCWKLMGSYSWLHMNLHAGDTMAGDSPQQQFQIRSYLNLPGNLELNNALYYVDTLPNQGIPSYFRLDAGLVWRPNRSWEIGIWGQNLLNGRHAEFTSRTTPMLTEVPRGVTGRVTLLF
jgi:iron complex outermembrane receptor protein